MLLVDAANVIGSRPDGWWRDRPGSARRFVERVRAAVAEGRLAAPVTVVLEGAARGGMAEETVGGVSVLHARGSGDERLVEVTVDEAGPVTLVSADRDLRRRCGAEGADAVGPGWLLERLEGPA